MDEDQARSEAEARRQRILDAAGKRMDRVNGLLGDEGKEAVEDPSAKKSSKLAAMRKRRFRKSTNEAGAASTETTTEATTTEPKETEPATTESKETEAASPPAESKEVTPAPETKETNQTLEEKADKESEAASTETAEEPKDGTSSDAPKKYMGVAKMRRKMIKEKQQKQQGEQADESVTSVPKKFSKITPPKPVWPIMLHLLTILCLFLAGFEVGLQQNVIEYRDDVTIHQTLAPKQEMKLLNQGLSFSSSSPSPQIIKEPVEEDTITTPYREEGEEEADEFGPEEEEDVPKEQEGEGEENLDPLFGVDLDALTAGPGVMNFFARFAVKAHRMLLSIFYYFPIAIWNNLLGLVASPPVLCLTALAIRQGSQLLGGKLPQPTTEEAKTANQGQDIMATIRNVVTNFILKAFPTATKLYEAWTHLRSDMYVVMCGLFVGLVWHHYLSSSVSTSPSDEL